MEKSRSAILMAKMKILNFLQESEDRLDVVREQGLAEQPENRQIDKFYKEIIKSYLAMDCFRSIKICIASEYWLSQLWTKPPQSCKIKQFRNLMQSQWEWGEN